jgi:arsenate reductase
MVEDNARPSATGARKRRVLFVSTRNAGRSLMAAAWLRQAAGERFEVDSAGTHPAAAPHPVAVAVMLEVGIDLSRARPRALALARGSDYDLVIVLAAPEPAPAPPQLEGARELIHWWCEDPSLVTPAQQVHAYRRVRDDLHSRVSQLVAATTSSPP